MITTANYMIKAVVNNLTYLFQYEDSASVWEALQQFWYDDYPETPIIESGEMFPIDVIALDGGKVIRVYSFTFHPAAFHAFFDKGHIADGPYTLDQFAKDIERKKLKYAVVFGKRASRLYDDQDFDGLHKALKEGDGSVCIYEFDTEAERREFQNGIDAGDGWLEYAVVNEEDIEKVDFADV